MTTRPERLYGLIGYPLGHSFSKDFFNDKFRNENIPAEYINFEISDIELFEEVINNNPSLRGLNVTIPYKEKVIPYLNELDEEAAKIGAVNVIKFINRGSERLLKGYNSDIIGFRDSISKYINPSRSQALVLGTGGASKAVVRGLESLGVKVRSVSRVKKSPEILTYDELTPEIINNHKIIVNTTPLGMYPNIDNYPDIPYQGLTSEHLCYDLIYNPEETMFMKMASAEGAEVKSGLEMLIMQALAAWRIWNSEE